MKVQALILVGIILFSGFVLQNAPGFSPSEGGEKFEVVRAQTQIINTAPRTLIARPEAVNEEEGDDNKNVVMSNDDPQDDKILTSSSDLIEAPAIQNETTGSSECYDPNTTIVLAKTIDTQEVLLERNANYRWPAASITKLMTTVIAMDLLDFATTTIITQEIHDAVASHNTFEVGERYSINDLVRASLVASSNDATYALAEQIGIEEFVKKMNEKAKTLGMSETLFWEPSGLSYLNQFTANDLYALVTYIYHTYPALLEATQRTELSVYDLTSGTYRRLSNTNLFAGQSNFYGGKTGYIEESGQNLLALFNVDGKIVMIVVMASNDRFTDVERIYNCLF